MANLIVTVLGNSGTGKSTSIRNLDKKTTTIISTDSKIMPFKGYKEFDIRQVTGEKPNDLFAILKELKDDKTKQVIVLDAFTEWSDSLLFYCNQKYIGFERQNKYNDATFYLVERLKELENKIVFIFAHPVIGETFEGDDAVIVQTANKQRKGIIERASTILLMARAVKVDKELEYRFETKSNGVTPVKAPVEMFSEEYIPNDLQIVVDKIKEYYK